MFLLKLSPKSLHFDCVKRNNNQGVKIMSHFVLVHGAWEESGMWDNVAPILRQNGHTVTAVDLPGHGANKKEGLQVTTELYIEALVDLISKLDYPVILAGHSMNGALISHVAERIPEKIERLVYVTAFLLKNGGSVYSAMEGDADGGAFPYVEYSDDQAYATLPEASLRKIGLHDVDQAEIERILPMMAEWQGTGPFMSEVAVTEDNFGSVPKTYVRTSIDKMISPALQDTMILNWEVDSVFELESGHFPTSSVPDELADTLLRAAAIDTSKLVSNA
jgi:pimeloyl-ACP methyl ester carboxylesterase